VRTLFLREVFFFSQGKEQRWGGKASGSCPRHPSGLQKVVTFSVVARYSLAGACAGPKAPACLLLARALALVCTPCPVCPPSTPLRTRVILSIHTVWHVPATFTPAHMRSCTAPKAPTLSHRSLCAPSLCTRTAWPHLRRSPRVAHAHHHTYEFARCISRGYLFFRDRPLLEIAVVPARSHPVVAPRARVLESVEGLRTAVFIVRPQA
jgi:hypothetical protein